MNTNLNENIDLEKRESDISELKRQLEIAETGYDRTKSLIEFEKRELRNLWAWRVELQNEIDFLEKKGKEDRNV